MVCCHSKMAPCLRRRLPADIKIGHLYVVGGIWKEDRGERGALTDSAYRDIKQATTFSLKGWGSLGIGTGGQGFGFLFGKNQHLQYILKRVHTVQDG